MRDINGSLYQTDNVFYLDDRFWVSGVEDIDGGDNFADYCEEFFALLDEEDYFEN